MISDPHKIKLEHGQVFLTCCALIAPQKTTKVNKEADHDLNQM